MTNIRDRIFERKMTRITVVCCDIMMIIMMVLCPSWQTLIFLGLFAVITYFAFQNDDHITEDEEYLDMFGRPCRRIKRMVRLPQIQIFRPTSSTWNRELTDDVNEWILKHRDEIYGDINIELKIRDGERVVILKYIGDVSTEEVED